MSPTVSTTIKAGAALAVAGALAVWLASPHKTLADYVAIGTSQGGELSSYVVKVSDADLLAVGLFPSAANDAGRSTAYRYVLVEVCAPPSTSTAAIPEGMIPVQDSKVMLDLGTCAAGTPIVQAWEDTASNAGQLYACTCARTPGQCYWSTSDTPAGPWTLAPTHRTLDPGSTKATDAGTSCAPSPCVVLAGAPGPCEGK